MRTRLLTSPAILVAILATSCVQAGQYAIVKRYMRFMPDPELNPELEEGKLRKESLDARGMDMK